MESEQEKMQFLGLFGIYKESHKIMSSWSKIFSQITVALILPLSFIFYIHIEVTDDVLFKIVHHSKELTETQFDTPQHQKLIKSISIEWAIFFLFEVVYFIFFLIFYLLSTSAVVYTVASIYTLKEVTFNKVMRAVPKVLKRLMVTFFCTLVAGFVYNIMTVVVAITCAVTIGLRNGWIAIFVILYLVGLVYLTVIWQLSNVVTVLEDSYGFEAMMKSKELIKGKMGLFLIITLMFNVSFFVIQFLFGMVVVNGWKLFELSSMSIIALRIVYFFLVPQLFLFVLVVQTVLYFVCKSYHHQNIDKSALLDHLKVHQIQGDYEPLKAKDWTVMSESDS